MDLSVVLLAAFINVVVYWVTLLVWVRRAYLPQRTCLGWDVTSCRNGGLLGY